MKALAIVAVELRRLLRDRSNLFFVFLFPLLLIVFIGAQFGADFSSRVGVVAPAQDPYAAELAEELDALEGITVRRLEDRAALSDAVDGGVVSAGVVLPEGYGASLAAARPVSVEFLGRGDAVSLSVVSLLQAALAEQEQPGAAAVLLATGLGTLGEDAGDLAVLRAAAAGLQADAPSVAIRTTTLGVDEVAEEFQGLGQFDLGASSQLFLFTFLTSLAGAGALIQARRYGVATRMLSTPTGVGTVLVGMAGGRWAVAAFQAGYIVLVSSVVFGVNWGDPLGATLVIGLFTIVAAAGGMLVGSVFHNDSQAGSVGVGLGLGLAALGGSMVPIELYPETISRVALITPHAWANQAMAELVRRDGGVADILPELAALAGFAVVLLALGSWTLRRALLR